MNTNIQNRLKKRTRVIAMVCVVSVLCVLAPRVEAEAARTLKLADGSMGSYWYSYATTVVELLKKKIPGIDIVITPGGGSSNVAAVHQGKAHLALSLSPTAYMGYVGRAPFKEKNIKIREVAGLADNPFILAVWADSKYKTVPDLKGSRYNVSPRGYTSETLARQLFKVYGMSYKDFKKIEYASNRDAVIMMKDGHIDGMLGNFSRYAAYLLDLMSSKPIRILPLEESVVKKMSQDNPGLVKHYVPAKMYNQDKDVLTFTGWLHLIAGEQIDEQLVYDITKTLIENIDVLKQFSKGTRDLTPEQMATDLGIPFHPGAMKYYKEKGLK